MSPFGNALMNAKEGDELNFEINEQNYAYVVKRITAVQF